MGFSNILRTVRLFHSPPILVLSFGLNGITEFVQDRELYVRSYLGLIDLVRAASPQTRILLQSVYPVTANCTSWSVDGKTVSDYTRILNGWLVEIAQMREDVRYIDTASVLTDGDGCLHPTYDFSGDGIHLTADAYRKILCVLCKEAWV
jgi:lysophospholipase L1-like esterase